MYKGMKDRKTDQKALRGTEEATILPQWPLPTPAAWDGVTDHISVC